ncbi:MAG: hypothetical protein SW833_16205 [Cyanobacteriota bacterium]|nr:hypothetical protein [Cyanobacteriota bacterium]
MKKISRLYKIVASILLGILLVLGIGWLRLDSAIATNLQRNISTTLGVYPQIEELHYQLFTGRLNIENLTLNNPNGFATPYFMKANNLQVQCNPLSFLGKTTQLQEFLIERIDVNIEQKLTQNNALTILGNAKQQRKINLQANVANRQKKFFLQQAIVSNITSQLNLALGLLDNPLSVELPEIEAIELSNLTPENIQGVVLGDLIDRVVSGIMKKIVAESQTKIPENILKDIQESPLFSEQLPDFLAK